MTDEQDWETVQEGLFPRSGSDPKYPAAIAALSRLRSNRDGLKEELDRFIQAHNTALTAQMKAEAEVKRLEKCWQRDGVKLVLAERKVERLRAFLTEIGDDVDAYAPLAVKARQALEGSSE